MHALWRSQSDWIENVETRVRRFGSLRRSSGLLVILAFCTRVYRRSTGTVRFVSSPLVTPTCWMLVSLSFTLFRYLSIFFRYVLLFLRHVPRNYSPGASRSNDHPFFRPLGEWQKSQNTRERRVRDKFERATTGTAWTVHVVKNNIKKQKCMVWEYVGITGSVNNEFVCFNGSKFRAVPFADPHLFEWITLMASTPRRFCSAQTFVIALLQTVTW